MDGEVGGRMLVMETGNSMVQRKGEIHCMVRRVRGMGRFRPQRVLNMPQRHKRMSEAK